MTGSLHERAGQLTRAVLLVCTAWITPAQELDAQEPGTQGEAQPAPASRTHAETDALLKALRDAIRLLENRNTEAAIVVLRRLHDDVDAKRPKGEKAEDPGRAFMKRIEAAVEAGTMTQEEAQRAIRDYRVRQLREERRNRLERLKKRRPPAPERAGAPGTTTPRQPTPPTGPGSNGREPDPSPPDVERTQDPPDRRPAPAQRPERG